MNLRDNPNVHRATGLVKDFRDFILRGNVVDLAVGIVIGVAFTSLVMAFVKDIITPIIPTGGNSTLSTFHAGPFLIGDFINAVISFIIIAAVIFFFVVKPVNALTARFFPKKVEPPATRDCPYCLSSVPVRATRCAYCTSQLPVAGEAATGV